MPGVNGPLAGGLGPLGRAMVAGITYLLLDRFTTNASAPLTSPRTCEPGPGTLTITDTGNKLSISGGALNSLAGTGSDDPLLYSGTYARLAGRALLCLMGQLANGGSGGASPRFGWTSGISSGNVFGGVPLNGSISACIGGSNLPLLGTAVRGTAYNWAVIQRSTGFFLIFDGKLAWVDNTDTAATVRALLGSRGTGGDGFSLSNFRVTDLPAPWTTDYGIATQRLVSPAAGATFTHEANCLLDWTITTLPTAGTLAVRFRKQDSSNYWVVSTDTSANLSLYEVVAGVTTFRAGVSGVMVAGHRVVIVADGSVIKGYSNNVLRWTYSSATNFATATSGEVNSLGTGGVLSELVSWPRTLSGTALSTLAAV